MMKLARALTLAGIATALVAIAAFAYSRLGDGSSDTSARPIVTAQAERRTLRQSIVASGSVQYPRTSILLAANGGRVTGLYVSLGDTIRAGQPILSIDGRPAIAVPGDLPFWRDIAFGASGPDVLQLENALAAEGFDPGPIDESFTGATDAALRRWQAAHALPVDGMFRAADAFTGEWPARVGHVQTATGQFVSRGAELLTLTSSSLEVTLRLAPSQRLRVEEGLPVSLEVVGTRATMRGVLGPIAESAPGAPDGATSYVAKVLVEGPLKAIDGSDVSGTVTLAEAQDAVAVPVAAIVMNGQGSPAVQVRAPGGGVHLVSVTTGLSEGAFVQVTSGLDGGERILLEQPK